MAKDTALQVRVDSTDKEQAAAILDGLGLDLSTAVNMLLKQIILRKGLPFTATQEYESETEKYVRATMALEGMDLTEDEILAIRDIISGRVSIEDSIEELKSKYKR